MLIAQSKFNIITYDDDENISIISIREHSCQGNEKDQMSLVLIYVTNLIAVKGCELNH